MLVQSQLAQVQAQALVQPKLVQSQVLVQKRLAQVQVVLALKYTLVLHCDLDRLHRNLKIPSKSLKTLGLKREIPV